MAITTLNANDSGATSRTTINDNFTDLDTTKADLASPTFTGTVAAPALKITTGAGASKVLTSDADGDATWETPSGAITIETTTGTTHSLTTTAGQKVIVLAKGNLNQTGGTEITVTLKYNTVTKDTVSIQGSSSHKDAFALMYTEIPGAATQNITVETGSESIANVVIIVMKIG